MKLISPAKVNLFLRILGKREDGYHELASLFQAVDLADTLHFSLSEKDHFSCTDPVIPTGQDNLIWKAAHLFRQKTELTFGLTVHLEKNIPIQAGIGGGSSNAATTLWALNQLHGARYSEEQLCEWAGDIGSDISFFFSTGTAYCTGRGEKVKSLLPLSGTLWLVKPPEGLSTPLIYKTLNLNNCSKERPEDLLKAGRYFVNDLEEPAFQVLPKLRILKENLIAQGFSSVALTGSGTGLLCQGTKKPLLSPDIRIFPLRYLQRNRNHWYSLS